SMKGARLPKRLVLKRDASFTSTQSNNNQHKNGFPRVFPCHKDCCFPDFARRLQSIYHLQHAWLQYFDTYSTSGPHSSLTSDIINVVQSEPGNSLSKIWELLWDSSGPLLSIKAANQKLVNRLSITLEKSGTSC
ncbi:hypothetical protein VP01_6651g1, partial [Puccinia sorghi]